MNITPPEIVNAHGLGQCVRTPEGELHILRDIHLSIKAGEVVSIIGASGSGKSTLLGLLAGLDVPSEGTVSLAGHMLNECDEEQRAALRARLLGFVFQSFQLVAGFTARENVMLPLELAGLAEAGKRADQLLEKVGLADRRHHLPSRLSGGEQQRVAIARAFATEPALLLADEPTGNLDATTGERIIDMLFALNHEFQTTLVLVTHDQRLAARCDRSIELRDGCLVSGV